VSALRVTVSGATGLVGRTLLPALRRRGAEITILTRDPARARAQLGDGVTVVAWDPQTEPAPADALAGRDAIVNLAGAPVAQRWSESAKRAIRDSRVLGTRHLVAGIAQVGDRDGRPTRLVNSSAVGYYGPRGEEPLDEDAPAGRDFLAELCVEWEDEAARARELGVRVVQVRTGVVIDAAGGALARMLPPFRLGLGGPIAGGSQYVPWIHPDDLVGIMIAAIDDERWSGPVNGTAPAPVHNDEFARALGRVLGRPAVLPVPGLALRLLYGEMAQIVTGGARAVPARALVLGYSFRHPEVEEALRAALAG
jgi:uncharacterized protein (TIGR01777 family)